MFSLETDRGGLSDGAPIAITMVFVFWGRAPDNGPHYLSRAVGAPPISSRCPLKWGLEEEMGRQPYCHANALGA